MSPAPAYDFVQWTPGVRGHYESNYLKANSPDGKRGFSIKHNLLAPKESSYAAVLEIWCVLFDRDAGPPRVLKQTRRMTEIQVSNTALRIEGDDVLLTDTKSQTRLVDESEVEASWDLRFTSSEPPIVHLPIATIYSASFPKTKTSTPAPRLRFEGTLNFDGTEIDVTDWIGQRGHNWGSGFAVRYAYGACNLFEQDATAVVDMFTAELQLGPIRSPLLSLGVLRAGGRQYDFKSPRTVITQDSGFEFPHWWVQLRSGRDILRADWTLDPGQCAGLRYLAPSGKLSYIYDTKFANLTIEMDDLELNSDVAELKFLFSEPIDGIQLYGNDTLLV